MATVTDNSSHEPRKILGTDETRTASTATKPTLTVEDICALMMKRGNYKGSYDEAVKTIKAFINEVGDNPAFWKKMFPSFEVTRNEQPQSSRE